MSRFYYDIKRYCSSYSDVLLTKEEEVYYGNIIREGGEGAEDAIQIMFETNLRLVVKIVTDEYCKKMSGSLTADDLLSAGNVGLRKAVEKFDPSFGTKFSTYARYYIKKDIDNVISRNGGSSGFISMPVSASNKINKIRAA